MQAFHNDPKIKLKYLKRVQKHRLADNLIQGQGWRDGKGCAVGCTLEKYDHKAYETELGIPEWLARVEDTIFEGLSTSDAQKWPGLFLKYINTGADLNKIKTQFLIYIQKQNLEILQKLTYDESRFPKVKSVIELTKSAIKQTIEARSNNSNLTAANAAANSAANAASSAAHSANAAASSAAKSAASSTAGAVAWSAKSAAKSAAGAVAWSAKSAANAAYAAANAAYAAANAAESAAYSAAYSAKSAAWSARSAAKSAPWSAAWSAYSAAKSAAKSADSAAMSAMSARSAAHKKYANYLLKLMKQCK